MWAQTASQICVMQQLNESVQTDVAIIGGGFTGVSTALHLSEQRIENIVLEANQIGFGCSSRNQGTMAGGYYASTPSMIEQSYGSEQGKKMNRTIAASTALVYDLVKKHKIECGLRHTGLIWVAQNQKEEDGLNAAAKQWREYDVEIEFIPQNELRDFIATDYYFSGQLIRAFGRINTSAYCCGLALAAQKAGSKIFTGSRALKIEPSSNKWRVRTAEGEVIANKVLIGTNAYSDGLWPGLNSSYLRVPVLMTATDPVPELVSSMLPKGIPYHDINKLTFFGILPDHEGRLTGGVMPTFNADTPVQKATQPINWKYAKIYPDLPLPKWRYKWIGNMCMSRDNVARIYRLDNNIYAVMGYSGAGIAPATALGREASKLLAGTEADCAWPIRKLERIYLKPIIETGLKLFVNPLLRQGYRLT